MSHCFRMGRGLGQQTKRYYFIENTAETQICNINRLAGILVRAPLLLAPHLYAIYLTPYLRRDNEYFFKELTGKKCKKQLNI
jgi:hypothetical protein